jgi:hypothetical protein
MRGETPVEPIVWDARLEYQQPSLAEPAPSGEPPLADIVPPESALAERRLSALAAAVREHEGRVRAQIAGPRPHDRILHTRLRQILGSA